MICTVSLRAKITIATIWIAKDAKFLHADNEAGAQGDLNLRCVT